MSRTHDCVLKHVFKVIKLFLSTSVTMSKTHDCVLKYVFKVINSAITCLCFVFCILIQTRAENACIQPTSMSSTTAKAVGSKG